MRRAASILLSLAVRRSRQCRRRLLVAMSALSMGVAALSPPTLAGPPTGVDADVGADRFAALLLELARHPTVLALRDTVLSARERADAVSALPDPQFSLGINNFPLLDPSFDEYLPTNGAVGVSQSIPNNTVRRARSAAQLRYADSREFAVFRQLDLLEARLVHALVDRERVAEQMRIARERDTRYTALVEVIQTEIDAGRPLVFRLSQIDVERADVARELVALAGEAAEVDAMLIDLVGAPVTVPPPRFASMPVRGGDALEFHDVRLARSQVRIADAGVDEAEGATGPDWRVGLSWQLRTVGRGGPGSTFEGDDWVSANISFTLPVWRAKSQAPGLRAARAQRAAVHNESLGVARQAEARWLTLQSRVQTAERSIEILRTKLAALDAQIAALLTTYEAGRGDYSQVIDAEIARLTLQSQLLTHRAQRDKSIATAKAMLVTP
jgi:cobalt-zinc-cadmium efflux system outer membrane protein